MLSAPLSVLLYLNYRQHVVAGLRLDWDHIPLSCARAAAAERAPLARRATRRRVLPQTDPGQRRAMRTTSCISRDCSGWISPGKKRQRARRGAGRAAFAWRMTSSVRGSAAGESAGCALSSAESSGGRERVTELRRRAAGRKHAKNVVGGDGAGVDRRDDTQDVRPLALDAADVDLAARGRVQRPVVRADEDAATAWRRGGRRVAGGSRSPAA